MIVKQLKKDLDTKFFILLLFGSYAKNKQTHNSDIDICFIVPSQQKKSIELKINSIINIFSKEIHNFIFSEKEFKNMINSKEYNVCYEILKNNVILHGLEEYYELIKC